MVNILIWWILPIGDVCVFIPSPVRDVSTFLVITGVQFFRTELKPVRKVSEDANLKRFHNKVL